MKAANAKTLLIVAAGLLVSQCLADLRPVDIRDQQPVPTAIEQKGRRLLAASAQAAGVDRWQNFQTMSVEYSDHWRGIARFLGHWPEARQALRSDLLRGTFTSRAKLLDGTGKGETWGIQNWRSYKIKAGKLRVAEDPSIRFYLPTLHYFFELPFRIQTAEQIAYAGERAVRGRTYDTVFVTWGGYKPGKQYDQYMLYINQETQLIDLAHYTVREAGGFVKGTIHFRDYRSVQGVQIPFEQTVMLEDPEDTPETLDDKHMHQIRVRAVYFNAVPAAGLQPLPATGPGGDFKP